MREFVKKQASPAASSKFVSRAIRSREHNAADARLPVLGGSFSHDFSRIPLTSAFPISNPTDADETEAEVARDAIQSESVRGGGYDRVRIHVGRTAHELNESIRAQAFTYGQDIFFRHGAFDPNSRQGTELLAHELAHTVQNRDTAPSRIQRKVLIGSTPYSPTTEDYATFNKDLLDQLHNGGDEPVYSFATIEEFHHDVGIRTSAMKTILEVIRENNTSVEFGFDPKKGPGNFSLPDDFWIQKTRKEFHVVPSKTPANAVKSIFNNGERRTWLDCNMMLVAIQYKAILDTYGDQRFDKMFPSGQNLIIGQNKTDNPATPDVKEGYQSTRSGSHPFFDQKLYSRIEISAGEDALATLIPGDWVYFKNADDYLTLVDGYNQAMKDSPLDPGRYEEYVHYAELQGEHAIYTGEGTLQLESNEQDAKGKSGRSFAGFGLDELTYDGMLELMINACRYEYKALELAKKGDWTTDPNDSYQEVSPALIKGKPRITTIFRLDIANVEPLGK